MDDEKPTFRRMTSKNAPLGIKILSVLYVLNGVWLLVLPFVYPFFLNWGEIPVVGALITGILCWITAWIVASIYFGIAAGLLKGEPLGWIMAVIFAFIGLVFWPFGTVLNIIVLLYLFSPGIRKLYRERSKAAPQYRE